MSQLINEFIEDHKKILKALSNCKELKILTPEAQNELQLAKECLLKHLQKEDDLLYPRLVSYARNNSNLQTLLDVFASEMTEITNFAMDFFNLDLNTTERIVYIKKFGRLFALLKNRVQKEETLLYKELEKLEK